MPDIDRIRAEQTRSLYRLAPLGVLSAGGVALLIGFAGHGAELPETSALAWSICIVLCAFLHIGLCVTYRRAAPIDSHWRRWINLFTVMAFIEGVAWGAGAMILTASADSMQTLIILIAWAGVASGGAAVFGAYLPTYLAFLFPEMLPHVYLALHNQYQHLGLLVGLEIMFLILMPLIALQMNQQLITSMRLRFDNLDLAEDLRKQKIVAERASLAKSQLLAAASHDLRQPVHAIGLFVGALSKRTMDAGSRRLLEQIDKSVMALDDLFAGILDISKLDAGVVQAHLETFALAHVLERLVRDYDEEARAKSISVRLRPTAFYVESDPVLLERVLRNILSNAVRYTDRGGVLIGCRLCGDKVNIEIWDTGRGIPEGGRDLIFNEFYQIENPERDRSKGVGLGLAIVRRTVDLLGANLTLRSVHGRGTMFRVGVQLAIEGKEQDAVTEHADPQLQGKLICVVDDDLAVREAMQSLLVAWGHDVKIAGSGTEMIAHLLDHGRRPDLLICDYRLPGVDTGVAVIQSLHRYYNTAIPAIVITGDTAPDRIAEAQASGFVLLHKPLSSGKLRAAVGNMLR